MDAAAVTLQCLAQVGPPQRRPKGRMTRIFRAEDEAVVRQALRCLLERESDLRVVGEAADGLDAVPLVEQLKPDVLVTDVAMPGVYGLEVTRRVREAAPATGVVILSRCPDDWYLTEAQAAARSATWPGSRTRPSCCAPSVRRHADARTSARRSRATRSTSGWLACDELTSIPTTR
jgi:DNA-binding NarL/FixJ family response regulator